jgi:hypothetical protein
MYKFHIAARPSLYYYYYYFYILINNNLAFILEKISMYFLKIFLLNFLKKCFVFYFLKSVFCFCGLAGLFLCILPVYLGRFTLFLIKSSYLSKKKRVLLFEKCFIW